MVLLPHLLLLLVGILNFFFISVPGWWMTISS